MNEAQFSREIVAVTKGCGQFAYKTADGFQIGLPDIYITTGKWIESKLVRVSGKRKFSIDRDITGPQHGWMKNLIKNGDKCWVAVLIQFPSIKYFIIEEYSCIVGWPEQVDLQWVLHHCAQYTHVALKGRMIGITNV